MNHDEGDFMKIVNRNIKNDESFKIQMIPDWVNTMIIICKWFISTTPFIVCSIMFFFQSEMSLWDNFLLTSVYLLSLSNIINCLDNS
jgi:hypothetical protein